MSRFYCIVFHGITGEGSLEEQSRNFSSKVIRYDPLPIREVGLGHHATTWTNQKAGLFHTILMTSSFFKDTSSEDSSLLLYKFSNFFMFSQLHDDQPKLKVVVFSF